MTTVIYHSADYDGIFCREIARKFLGNQDVQYIGWNFGDPPLSMPDGEIFVMDLPLDKPFGFFNAEDSPHFKGLIWIDHHKSSIETTPKEVPGYRIDGVAACRLAWQYFAASYGGEQMNDSRFLGWPTKEDFIDRKVNEPYAVRLAGEYDVWDKRDPNADILQYGLRTKELSASDWLELLSFGSLSILGTLMDYGKIAKTYAEHINADICNHLTWIMEWEGLKFLCVNHARFNSLLFAAKDIPETGHDALLGFRFDGKNWMVSLYHAAHRTDIDLSEIAKKHGGGGHRGACGFTCAKLPFLTDNQGH